MYTNKNSKESFKDKYILFKIADEMANRILELDTKVRTPQCEIVENEFRDNLSDLRLLVAKEYSTMLIGLLKKYNLTDICFIDLVTIILFNFISCRWK